MNAAMIDGTVWPMDYQSPEARKSDAYRTVGEAARELIEREATAIRFLQSLGYRVIKES